MATLEKRSATEQIAKANAEADKANEHAQQARKEAEQERLARVKIEERLAPRWLKPEQQEAIATRLRPFAGQRINVLAYQGQNESLGIAILINEILLKAGWQSNLSSVREFNRAVNGMLVETLPKADSTTVAAANSLTSALIAEGIPVPESQPLWKGLRSEAFGNPQDDAMIWLTIGQK